MDIDGYRHNYEGLYEKFTYQMLINRGRRTHNSKSLCKPYVNSPISSLSLLVNSFEEEI